MHDEPAVASAQPLYLLKILVALCAIGFAVGAAFWLPLSGASKFLQWAGIVTLLVLAGALVPAVNWVYRRRDELQRLQHQQASVGTLAMLASASAGVGILQANQWLPLFNQFWTLGALLAVWAVRLMLADRHYQ